MVVKEKRLNETNINLIYCFTLIVFVLGIF